jgi:mycothiol synthase
LGVRRPWRRRGLGLALLRCAFGEFYRRDIRMVALAFDSQSLTGATRLYERAGMQLERLYSVYRERSCAPAVALPALGPLPGLE